MKSQKLVVIGGDAGGMTAASLVRRIHKDWEIVVLEKGSHTSYASCGLPYYIGGLVDSYEALVARKPEEFREKYNIDVRVSHEALEIDRKNQQLRISDLANKEEYSENYDKLLIATGALPVVPDVNGIASQGVFTLSGLQSGIVVKEYTEKYKPRNAVIVGGGYIGLEMAEAFLERGMKVNLIDMAPQLMTTLDKDMADPIREYMEEQGVIIHLNESLDSLVEQDGRIKQVKTSEKILDADIVIIAVGARPNSKLAKDAGLELGVKDTIRVNIHQQTSDPYIWAAGDCTESYNIISDRNVYVALGTVANKQSLVAGKNIAGVEEHFPGVCATAITRFREMEIARTGLSEKELRELSIPYRSAVINSSSLSSYFPGTGRIRVKLIAHKEEGYLLGGQIVGFNGSAKRIDTIITAMSARMTSHDLLFLDLSYAPPFSPVWDPVQVAARQLI